MLDEMLSSFLMKDFKHQNCRVCNRKLTDPVSIYLGVGPECAKTLHDQLDIKMPQVQITVELNSDSDFEYESGACYVDIFIESICPWTEQTIQQVVIRIESVDWNTPNRARLKDTFDRPCEEDFMDGVIETIACQIRYDYHRGNAGGWDMLNSLFEDLDTWDPWPEIARQVAIVDTNYLAHVVQDEIEALAADDHLFENVTVHAYEFEQSPSYDDLKLAPVNLFTYDFTDDDGYYSVESIKEACNDRPRALLWIFAQY